MPLIDPIDPEHEQVHRVRQRLLERYLEGSEDRVKAQCGKIWSPQLPLNLDGKPYCPICFPAKPIFAIAA